MSLRRFMRVVASESMPATETPVVHAAFATTDMKHVDQHFGTAKCYAVYQVTPREANLLCAAQFRQADSEGGEGKLTSRIALLQGCTLIYCEAIGGGAIRRLAQQGIRPMRVAAGVPISVLIAELQQALSQDTELLRRCLPARAEPRDEARFDRMEAEGWAE